MSLRILIVDDDKHTCRILQTLIQRDPALRERGVQVVIAGEGGEGLQALAEGPVDLVISDLLMPGMDGFTFCRELRRRPGGEDVPLIVSSAVYKDPITVRKLHVEVGAEFFTKPFQVAEMIGAVRRLLGVGARAAAVPPCPAPEAQGLLLLHPLPRLLLDLFEGRGSTCLHISRGELHLRVHLIMGHVVAADSSNRSDALGGFLLGRGLLTEEQLCAVLSAARDQGRRLGQVLMERGWITEALLIKEMEAQMRQRIAGALRWREGSYRLETPRPAHEHMTLQGGTPHLVFRALCDTADPDEIAEGLKRTGRLCLTPRYARMQAPFEQVFGALGPVAGLGPGGTGGPLGELLFAGRAEERDALLVRIDALLRCGLATLTDGAAAEPKVAARRGTRGRAAEVQEQRGEGLPAAAPEGESPGDGVVLGLRHRQLLAEYLAADGKDYYTLLAVARDVDLTALQAAYQALLDRLSPERFRDLDLGPDYGKISELRDRYRHAFAVLSSPVRRAAYDRELSERQAQEERGAVQAELLFREGAALLSGGDLPGAVPLLEQAAAQAPDQADYAALLGWARFLLRRHQGAEAQAAALIAWPSLQRALRIDEAHAAAHAYFGHIDVALQMDERAAGHFERVLDLHPDRRDVIAGLTRALTRTGQWQRLLQRYRRLLRRLGSPPRDAGLAAELTARVEHLLAEHPGPAER